MAYRDDPPNPEVSEEVVHLPTPTAWPLVLAVGLTLALAGLVTNAGISLLGAVLIVAGCFGWFGQVWPHAQHVAVPVKVQKFKYTTVRKKTTHIQIDETHRARLPVHTPSVMAGVKGGIAGGAAMIVPAVLYGLIAYHSIWYPINLLGGAALPAGPTPARPRSALSLKCTHCGHHHPCRRLASGRAFVRRHASILPKRPILLGGIIAPVLWTGFLHSAFALINPFLAARIDWRWFVVSQLTFGLVAGWVVAQQAHIRTEQYLPFAARVGLETPGMMDEDNQEDGKK